MQNPTIKAVKVVELTRDPVVKVDLQWIVEAEDVTVGARLTIPEARAWIDGLVSEIEEIEEREDLYV